MPINPNGFFNLNKGLTKGKTLEAVLKSRDARAELIQHFGGEKRLLPSSVMLAKKSRVTNEIDGPGKERSYSATSPLQVALKSKQGRVSTNEEMMALQNSKSLRAAQQISGSGAGAGNISIFWQDVGTSMLKLYTEPGQVVVDPFAGHNSRMEMCVRAGRHYIGHDLSAEFMRFNRKRAAELREEIPEVKIKLYEGDSRKLQAWDECGDFCISSPPYWDIEYYGDEPEQLGNNTYEGFLEGMQSVFHETFRCLKPGAYVAWFVNDFRKGGKFYPYHYDSMTLAAKAGFEHHDMLIVDLGRGFGDVFVNQYIAQKRLPKRHEYGIIFRKPANIETSTTKPTKKK